MPRRFFLCDRSANQLTHSQPEGISSTFGYLRPPEAKTYGDWQKDPAATSIYQEWFRRLRETPNCTAIAAGIKAAVLEVLRNPELLSVLRGALPAGNANLAPGFARADYRALSSAVSSANLAVRH